MDWNGEGRELGLRTLASESMDFPTKMYVSPLIFFDNSESKLTAVILETYIQNICQPWSAAIVDSTFSISADLSLECLLCSYVHPSCCCRLIFHLVLARPLFIMLHIILNTSPLPTSLRSRLRALSKFLRRGLRKGMG